MSFNYPVFLSVEKKKCVVIGGGNVATRKIAALLACGAEVTVAAKKVTQKIRRWSAKKKIQCFIREFRPSDLKGAWLVIAATNDPELNEKIFKESQKRRQWVNVVDKPPLCQLIYPSVIRKGALTMAISTNGASPAMAKAIRKDLEKNFIPKYEQPLKKIARQRRQVLKTVGSVEKRRQILNQLAQGLLKGI
ncbi:MAG: bifunctional precorrin-2 dehydrogenase/sirohydrochlorin ferrochelatase [Candidatus Omnitrophica bacterium]|nr:bifunctional precorrin-2 dehydrogenase/sirohydrochlorin ferrochelatase [Candidatus Omnitrophota bacterium]